jgi:hypothetical protein
MRHPRLIVTLFTLLAALLAYSAGQQQGRDSVTFTIPPSADADVPPLPIPPVTEIAPTGDVADVVAYYTAHEDEVIALFGDADRAAALLDDNGADSTVYFVASNGTSWWYAAMTKAT